ncbi:MAG: CoA pyrophosphatase [Pseudomonadota bacterium]|nr:CoA pyrophosphatase [Pseudomonadota bacterium]MDQ2704650.1 CoA pyrophosphatase [Pseudomonadota bacterium]
MMGDLEAPPFSAEDFRLRAAIDRGPHDGYDYGDHRFNPGHPRVTGPRTLVDAAVLIPVVDHGGEASVILTKRAETLTSHAGQVAFPGGRIDPTDASPEDAALREAWEEIGLDASQVEVIGRVPDYLAGSGYRIAPVLSIVRPGFHLTINEHEVDAAFEVPLRFLMDPANHTQGSREINKRLWVYYDMPYGGQRIWGVTAGIIRTLYERLYL